MTKYAAVCGMNSTRGITLKGWEKKLEEHVSGKDTIVPEVYLKFSTIGELRRAINKLPLDVDDTTVLIDGSPVEILYYNGDVLDLISA